MQHPIFNITRGTDSYKASHWKMLPPGTQYVQFYFEPRGCDPNLWDGYVVPFSLQYFLKQYFVGKVVTMPQVELAKVRWAAHFNNSDIFNYFGFKHIAEDHAGMLPLRIRAVLEGTVLPLSNVLFVVENTCPHCAWLPGWVETVLEETWDGSTVATNSRECNKILDSALEKSGDPAGLPFKLHDFGFRGVGCPELAAILGMGHLLSFQGTDTFIACDAAMDFYGSDMPGFSIPASEHSVVGMWGKDGELDFVKHLLEQFPTGLVASVSDTYDLMRMINVYYGKELRDKIISRNGVFVARPDSGDPIPTVLDVFNGLGAAFGTIKNGKDYRLLPPQIRAIQGDGMNKSMLRDLTGALMEEGWSIDNIAFGSGGGLLQKFNRDDLSFAYKCCWAMVDGRVRDVFKDPITMSSKRSKRGRLSLVKSDGVYRTISEDESRYAGFKEHLELVYQDGKLLIDQKFSDIRARAA